MSPQRAVPKGPGKNFRNAVEWFDISGGDAGDECGALQFDIDNIVPDHILNELLDGAEVGDGKSAVKAASSSWEAPSFIVQGGLSAEQMRRIEANRQVGLAMQATKAQARESCGASAIHFKFDDSDGEDFQDQPDLSQELDYIELPSLQVKRRKLLHKTNPIGTGYPVTALISRTVYKI